MGATVNFIIDLVFTVLQVMNQLREPRDSAELQYTCIWRLCRWNMALLLIHVLFFFNTFQSIPIFINFNTMTCTVGDIQRLSTPSSVNCRNKIDATVWQWFWNGGNEYQKLWIKYEVRISDDLLRSVFGDCYTGIVLPFRDT
jgi:hypothetical protein